VSSWRTLRQIAQEESRRRQLSNGSRAFRWLYNVVCANLPNAGTVLTLLLTGVMDARPRT
jgi:hypothetical protein